MAQAQARPYAECTSGVTTVNRTADIKNFKSFTPQIGTEVKVKFTNKYTPATNQQMYLSIGGVNLPCTAHGTPMKTGSVYNGMVVNVTNIGTSWDFESSVVESNSDYTTYADGTIEYVKSKVDSLIETRAKTKYFELGNIVSGASKTFNLNQLGTHDFVIINAYLVNTTFYNLGIIKKSYYNELFVSLSSYLMTITLSNGILTITQSSGFELPLMVSFIYA